MTRRVRLLLLLSAGCMIAGMILAIFSGPIRLTVVLVVGGWVWAFVAKAEDDLDLRNGHRARRISDGNR